jgi:ferredoxin/flavodoxin
MSAESPHIALVYFSATHVTKSVAQVMHAELARLGCDASLVNVTPYPARIRPLPVGDFDGLIFGFPVFADFAPSVVRDWLPTLAGQGKPCATFFTYGARTTGYAHFDTKCLLEAAGFRVLFTAEFLGRHTFNVGGWRVLPDRPDESDFAVARQFAAQAVERFGQEMPPAFHLQKPFGYNLACAARREAPKKTERGWTNPVRAAETCSMCRDCEAECPTEAFDAETGLSDPGKCIECMHCLYICPDEVIQIDARMKDVYADFLADWHLTEEIMQAKQSKIITQTWQAAA